MCVSYCLRQGRLYWNHFDCEAQACRSAGAEHPPCHGCHWRLEDSRCGLTSAPLPIGETGCCHRDLLPPPDEAVIEVTGETVAMLAVKPGASVEAALQGEGVPYRRDKTSRIWVDLNELALPYTYGLGTEHLPAEVIDWSDWFEQWEARRP